MMKTVFASCFLSMFCVFSAIAQGLDIVNYLPAEYEAFNQNWSVARSNTGLVYFANNGGLLEYDGTNWRLYAEKNGNIVRSVFVDSKSRIFTGSFEEFGIWELDDFGELQYRTLVDQELKSKMHNDEIWGIQEFKDGIYFHSFGKLFRYNSHQSVEIVEQSGSVLNLSAVNNELLAFGDSPGIFKLEGDKLDLLHGSEVFNDVIIHSVLSINSNEILVGTAKNGLFLERNKQFEYWDCECSEYLIDNELNRAVRSKNGSLLFGTIQSGVVICDQEGRIKQVINKESGLQNNTVLGMYFDEKSNLLWLALNNGIAKIDLKSPYLKYNHDNSFGAVFTAAYYRGKLFLGTNQGIYYKYIGISEIESINDGDFQLIKGSQGQVWDMRIFDDQLLVGHNAGTYRLVNNEVVMISDNHGGWNFKRFTHEGEEYLLQSTYASLVLFRKDDKGFWKIEREYNKVAEPLRFIEIDGSKNIWAGHEEKGVYKITLQKDLSAVSEIKYYGKNQGFPSEQNINVFKIKDEIMFASEGLIYRYDAVSDSVIYHSQLNEILLDGENIRRVSYVGNDNYWMMSSSAYLELKFDSGKFTLVNKHPYSRFGDFIPERFENVTQFNDSLFFFCYSSGFSIYNRNRMSDRNIDLTRPILRKMSYGGMDQVIDSHHVKEFKNGDFDLKFEFGAPVHGVEVKGFRFKLEGLDQAWRSLQPSPMISFSRLPMGDYTLRAKYCDDLNDDSQEFSFQFKVLSPWYLSNYALMVWSLLILMVYLIVRHAVNQNIRRKQLQLRDELEEERKLQALKDKADHEKQLILLKNERLEEEINLKTKQLTATAMGNVKKNDVLIKLREELTKRKKLFEDHESETFFKSIFNMIDADLNDEKDWSLFAENFDQIHQKFILNIKEKYPRLTPNEIRFCTYLRINLTSKEIASLMNITVGGVEVKRYRLRKKLNLTHDQNLVSFLMDI